MYSRTRGDPKWGFGKGGFGKEGFQTLTSTDAQTPFLGTPLVPLKKESHSVKGDSVSAKRGFKPSR